MALVAALREMQRAAVVPQLQHVRLLGREKGDFMSFAHTPQRFSQRWMRAHSPIPGLYFTGQDVGAAGLSGANAGSMAHSA